MHPINSHNFGVHGIAVSFYNGSATVPGYILKQTGTSTFKVTNLGATITKIVKLAPTIAIAGALTDGYCTINVTPSGVTRYTAGTTVVLVNGGTGYAASSPLVVPGGTFTATAVGGIITAVGALTPVGNTTTNTNPVAATGGTGTGATFTVTYTAVTVATETVTDIYSSKLVTAQGNTYFWDLGASVNGSAFIAKAT